MADWVKEEEEERWGKKRINRGKISHPESYEVVAKKEEKV